MESNTGWWVPIWGHGPWDPRGVPVGLIQDEHLDAAQVEGRAVVKVINKSAWGGDEDVRRCPKSCFLRLYIQAACGKSPTRQPVQY